MSKLDQVKDFISHNPVLETELKEEMLRLVEYIKKHPDVKYYPLSKIKTVTKTVEDDTSLQIASFFSGDKFKILEPKYSYILEDNHEIELTRSEFQYYLFHREVCLNKEGVEVCPVIRERLSLYFAIAGNVETDSDEWDVE
ncbi:hypothetical protein OQ853_06660 [Enterobacter roggenkampii]|uniref:hypothetical protein n=1 Tax=Enterobacter roggenkampii TaxID=1812935 RepID=UPI0007B3CEAA|nr:hypothetical protein [Enterobacter roggenkampii]ASG37980.1 hypothetical protein CES92_02985 [Enterobacter roggenkampii]EMF0891722.1 hypothetical protein [Enterobacter roggenkampii]KZQ92932.1 hypothetical protein A3465_15555 [Enterobacter roggenkampii]MDK4549078.1 hypothetical protein [Enterobacter roggenkampii]MDX7036497.1 hypothetical protein [Enterobacter roggenkampii]